MRDGLLPRMEARLWADGKTFTYRYHPVGRKPVNLGTDLQAALRRVLDMNGESPHHGTFTWAWEQYQTSKRWKALGAGTRAGYVQAWKEIDKRLGHVPVASIQPSQIARYVHIDRVESPRRADLERTLMSNVFKHAILLGACQSNPTVDVDPHGSTPSEVMPETIALKKFVTWLDGQGMQRRVAGQMAEFAALAGCRQVEFLDVAWSQVDEAAGVIRMKRAKQRGRVVFDAVEIKPAMAALLARLPRDGPWLFTNRGGNPYAAHSFSTQWCRCIALAIKLGVITAAQRFNFHALRRYYTTMHRAEYGDLPDIHADKRLTSRVYDATKEIPRRSL